MMKRTNSRVLMTLILGMCFALLAVPGWAGQGAKLMGPVAGGSQGAPFAAPAFDLESQGYVAEEYFLEGEASAYRLAEGTEHTADGRWRPLPQHLFAHQDVDRLLRDGEAGSASQPAFV